jgi:oxygen-dependent protoporphyrinogen oxidase
MSPDSTIKSVAVIGAGITGLTAAFCLKRRGVPVTVYEAGPRGGGVIQSVRKEGFLAEYGPNTILETSPLITQLVQDAGLALRRRDSAPTAEARYVVRYQRPILMPGSPLGFISTKLFSMRAKLAILREPFVKPRRDGVEESIAQFVQRRLNQEYLDHAIDAMVAGVYAGDPYQLSLLHAFPRLKALEDNYGSMIRGQILGAKERKKRKEVAKSRAAKFSFDEGLQVLPDTLAAHLGESLHLNTSVQSVTRGNDGWNVRTDAGEENHSAVVYCGTAFGLAQLQLNAGPAGDLNIPLELFSEVKYPPVASVVLGFKRGDVRHPCAGFGMLIPRIEGFKILGTIFSSSLFPDRAPAGHLTLTSYIGGARYPELAGLPPEKLIELTLADLRVLFGISGQPVFTHTAFYPRAIPQYNVGYGRFRQRLTEIEQQAPGFYFAGHYRDGVSLGDSIVSGVKLAERLSTKLKSVEPIRA